MSEIRIWLEAIDLGKYADAFEKEQVSLADLPDLTEDDLKDLGLSLGPRKTFLRTVRQAEGESIAPPPSGAPPAAPSDPEAQEAEAIAVSEKPVDPSPGHASTGSAGGERRQLTVMFCDLVDSTALSGRLDPEDLRNVVRAYQDTAAAVINRYEGHIAQYLGDGLLVYFGHPVAHEDDARRAVLAGLEIIEEMAALNVRLQREQGVRLALRLGIHTGVVVLGEMGGGERHGHLALGDTPNIAARLEGLAAPDTIVISGATARLVQDGFTLEELGPQTLKGVAEPMMAARVLQPNAVSNEADAGVVVEGRFLVGRDEEVGLLRRRWEQSMEGSGQVVVLTGEAGIGKSTLVETLYGTIAESDGVRVVFRCSPYHQNSALYPIIEHLQRVLGFEREDTPADKFEKLEQLLKGYEFTADDTVPLFAALLSVALPEGRYPPLTLSPQQQRQYTHDALVAWLTEETERTPVLVVFEDLHWADASTMEMVGVFVEEVPTVRMLIVLTARPEFVPPWPPRSHLTPLTLNRLERPQVAALVTHLAGGKTLPEDVVQHVVSKTDGVPLFVEELTKTLLESDILEVSDGHYRLTGPLASLSIPSTLHDSLMARLDRLPESKEVAQLGSVLGREFAYEMVKALTVEVDATLQSRLGELVEAEMLYQRGRPPRSKYTFKHALIQDAAYASLLHSTRRAYHQSVAEMLEQQFPDLVETQPELVASHYSEAGSATQAIPYWLQAGQRAAERFANEEAISHFKQGLEVVAGLPESPERGHQELALLANLGPTLMAARGWAAPELGALWERTRTLIQSIGETPLAVPVSYGAWSYYLVRGEQQEALPRARELMALAEQSQDEGALIEAHFGLCVTSALRGELVEAQSHGEQAVALYGPTPRPELALNYGHDPAMASGVFTGWALWLLGYPDRATEASDAGLAMAEALAHPHSTAYAHSCSSFRDTWYGDTVTFKNKAEVVARLSQEQGFPFMATIANLMQANLMIQEGQLEAGIEAAREALASYCALGSGAFVPEWSVHLAEGLGRAGQFKAGLETLTEARGLVEQREERYYEAELYRLQGELTLGLGEGGAEATAEGCYLKAIEVAHAQQAKSLELRAVMSLARLWQQQGKVEAARKQLAVVYDWFTEGFDTQDLQEAKVLLEELT